MTIPYSKLYVYGILGIILKYDVYNNQQQSESRHVKCGVLQGSVLGDQGGSVLVAISANNQVLTTT